MSMPEKQKNALAKLGEFLLDNPLLKNFAPNPNNYPDVIYKYRKWNDEYQKRLLTHNELYMSPASLFNDPFDCKIYKNHYLLDTPEKIEEYINRSMKNNEDWMRKNNKKPEEQRKILEERLSNLVKYQVTSEYYEDDFNNKYNGIASFSKRWDSILMWSHYAENHKGFAIGYDEKRMRFSMLFGKGDYVQYSDDFPEIHPHDDDNKVQDLRTFCKSKEWMYEEEYRFMNLYFDVGGADIKSEKRKVKLDDKFIVEIILGVCMPKEDKEEIIKIAKSRNLKVFEMVKVPFKFELEKFEVE
jgi:Protein of unknown function (DUF2971)